MAGGRCVMLTVSVRTDINESIARRLASASGRAEHAVAVQAEKDTQPFVPALTGSLTGRTAVRTTKSYIPAHMQGTYITASLW